MKLNILLLSLIILLPATQNSVAQVAQWSDNELQITESIFDVGGGIWQYDYQIVSSEPSNVWFLFFYTDFNTFNETSASFPNSGSLNIANVYPEYDARNLDANITFMAQYWFTPFAGANGINQGEVATFSFQSTQFDDSQKLYGYETGASGWAGGNAGEAGSQGLVHALGFTTAVPEPNSMVVLGLIALGAVTRRKR